MTDDVEREFRTNESRVRAVIEEYAGRYPGIHESYTLVYLLVLRREGAAIPESTIRAAARGELPNMTSVHRALTLAKKDYQTPAQRFRSYETEGRWRRMFGDLKVDAEGWEE